MCFEIYYVVYGLSIKFEKENAFAALSDFSFLRMDDDKGKHFQT